MVRRIYRRRRKVNRLALRVKKLERELKPEKKRAICVSMNSLAIGNDNPFDESILDLSGGTNQHSRIGNQVRMTSYYGKFLIKQFAGDQNAIYRVVMYRPKNDGDTLYDHDGTGSHLGFTDRIDIDRFSVMKDFTISMQKTGASSSSSLTDIAYYKPFTLAHKFKKPILQVYDKASAGTLKQGDIRLYITSTTGITNCPLVDGKLDVFYTDI